MYQNVSMGQPGDVTALLRAVTEGSHDAERQLVELVYPRLRQIARAHLRAERHGHTLQPTALVNEAYLQIAGHLRREWHDRGHFIALAAQVMRRLLVDHARRRNAIKRQGGRQRVELTPGIVAADGDLDQALAIDQALGRLAGIQARGCQVVRMRFFAGMTEREVAAELRIGPRTVKRDWHAAKAWLSRELRPPAPP